MDSSILEDIEKLIKYNSAADSIPVAEFSDTVAGFWDYIEERINKETLKDRNELFNSISDMLGHSINGKLEKFFLTVLLNEYKDSRYYELLCNRLLEGNFNCDEAFFAIQQFNSFDFRNPNIIKKEILWSFYNQVVDDWKEVVSSELDNISCGDADYVLIVTTHMAGERHAPTKTLMERIDTLVQDMGKKVFVIHSMECMTQEEYFPFYNCQRGIVIEEYSGYGMRKTENGSEFLLYQPYNAMPNVDEMITALKHVKKFNPGRMIVMGDFCVLGDVLATRIPTLNISFGFSEIYPKKDQYVAVFRKITKADEEKIEKWGLDKNKYFSGLFTFRFIPQETIIKREELGIKDDEFVFVSIGNRLGTDLDYDFISMLCSVNYNKWRLVLAGADTGFSYDEYCRKYPEIVDKTIYVGYVDDILALLDCTDLYVNPPRVGGGFSVAEAFSKGVPGVSLNYGDVAAAAGEEFCVETLDDMKATIERYIYDKEFYNNMREAAMKRAEILQDSKAALIDLWNIFEERIKQEKRYEA